MTRATDTRNEAWAGRWAEVVVYLDHLRALLVPGRAVKAHEVASPEFTKVGDLEGWSSDDLALLIEEGRNTLDRQASRFDRVRTTAQVLLPTASSRARRT